MDTRVQRVQPQLRLRDIDALTVFERAVAAHDGGDWQNDPEIGFRFLEAAARCVVDGVDLQVRDAFTPFGEGRGAKRAARAWLRLLDDTAARNEFITPGVELRSEEHTSELQSLMRISYAVFCLKKKQ